MKSRQPSHEITRILIAINAGDSRAADQLFPLIYNELRRMARTKMRGDKGDQTLQPTALVHEVYLRLVGNENESWENRGHFFHAAAEAMRHILIDRARRRARLKRGGNRQRIDFNETVAIDQTSPQEFLALDQALSRLEKLDPAMSKVVKLRYFAGLTVKETAKSLGISPRTVDRHWAAARAWLYREMERSSGT